jgi:hypothetical protein
MLGFSNSKNKKNLIGLLRIISIASLETPILSFEFWQIGQDLGRNKDC